MVYIELTKVCREMARLKLPALLQLNKMILDELKRRGVVRTNNNIVGDLAEKLFAEALGWTLAENSQSGYDAVSASGQTYQIKARRCAAGQNTVRFGAIREMGKEQFDYLAYVVFDENYLIRQAAILPRKQVSELCLHQSYTNADILCVNLNTILDSRDTEDVTDLLRRTLDKL